MDDQQRYERFVSRHGHYAFDWQGVERGVDGGNSDAAPFDERIFTSGDLAAALAGFSQWLIFGGGNRHGSGEGWNRTLARRVRRETIAARAIASAWMLKPSLFDGESLATVGELPQVRLTRKVLCDHAQSFEKAFGIRCRAMRTETNRTQLSEAARLRWQRTKANAKPLPCLDPAEQSPQIKHGGSR